ncbi:putative signaling protein [Fundidesulfovibrio magnetotacticus]|uniref:Putative signaling protein n=2 Tax=Fundidesulfovibrio magnetotacticus TaxID=2730080 RepID=A0A6V8LSY5_9BACT|nr:putative signaling protein [Fundidesulfovibrio magnetotacticus]
MRAAHLEEALHAVHESEERYRRLLETVTNYVYTVRVEDGRAVETTHGEGCVRLTGYTAEEYAADPLLWYRMVHEEDRAAVLEQAARLLRGESAPALEHRILHKDGSERWVRNTPVIRRDAFGRVAFYDGILQDITGAKNMEEAARHASLHDALTGLANRHLLMDRLSRTIESARRDGVKVAVLFLDLDNFKPVNDRLGHAVGDEVLKEAAARVLAQVRASDTVARVGGDEFVVVLPGQMGGAGAAEVSRKIIRALGQPYASLGGAQGPGGSVGISLYPDDGQDPWELVKMADQAMYYVKNHIRSSFAFHSSLVRQAGLEPHDS